MNISKIKQEWIDELESGKYKQGRGELYTIHSQSYCCLGVLGKILGYSDQEMVVKSKKCYDHIERLMPIETMEKLWRFNDGTTRTNNHLQSKLSFKEIAQYIKDNSIFYDE